MALSEPILAPSISLGDGGMMDREEGRRASGVHSALFGEWFQPRVSTNPSSAMRQSRRDTLGRGKSGYSNENQTDPGRFKPLGEPLYPRHS